MSDATASGGKAIRRSKVSPFRAVPSRADDDHSLRKQRPAVVPPEWLRSFPPPAGGGTGPGMEAGTMLFPGGAELDPSTPKKAERIFSARSTRRGLPDRLIDWHGTTDGPDDEQT